MLVSFSTATPNPGSIEALFLHVLDLDMGKLAWNVPTNPGTGNQLLEGKVPRDAPPIQVAGGPPKLSHAPLIVIGLLGVPESPGGT